MIGAILFCLTIAIKAQRDSTWTLDRCIYYALEKNIQVRKCELSNQRSLYYADQAKAQRFPSLNASVNKEIAALDGKIAKAGYFPTLSASAGLGIFLIVMITFSKVNNSSLDQF